MKARRDVNEKKPMDEATKEMDPESREKALRIAHKYEIGEEDPAWILVRLAVESISDIEKVTIEATKALREASVKVTEATRDEVKASREKAGLEITKAQEEAKASLSRALDQMMSASVQKAVNQIVASTHAQVLKVQARKWALVGAISAGVLVSVLAGGAAWEGYKTGLAGGYASGLAVGGNFRHFMDCDEPGWKAEWDKDGKKLYCYPHVDKDGTQYGWRIK